jgi:glycosyltransferase involved in cell wall biosynthesis
VLSPSSEKFFSISEIFFKNREILSNHNGKSVILWLKKIGVLKRVIVSVINDLVTDQRVNKSCLTLQKAGFEVLLVGRRQRKSPPMDDRPYKSHRMKLLFEKGPMFYATFNIRLFIFLLFHRCDCLLSNDLDTLLPNFWISKMKRIPLIYDSHEYFTEVPELVSRPKVQRVWKRIEEYVVPKLPEMITVNQSIADLFHEKYGIKVHIIRNIPMRKMLPAPASRQEVGLDPNKHILVLQGSGINIHRGSEELLDAMQYLDDCQLVIIGGGDVLPILKEKVAANHWDDRVKFFPRMPYQQMMAITQLAELGFTLDKDTNLNYRFSLPNKLFDYIQAGVPIIASHLTEIERIITDYNIGAFIDNHEPKTIAATIQNALNDEKILSLWKNNLIFAAQNLCWENEEGVLLRIYEKYV